MRFCGEARVCMLLVLLGCFFLQSAAMERHDAMRGQLESRHALLATHHEALGAERDALGQRVDSLSAASTALATWLKENEQRPVMQVRRPRYGPRFAAPHW
jgi:hypothetical protein